MLLYTGCCKYQCAYCNAYYVFDDHDGNGSAQKKTELVRKFKDWYLGRIEGANLILLWQQGKWMQISGKIWLF